MSAFAAWLDPGSTPLDPGTKSVIPFRGRHAGRRGETAIADQQFPAEYIERASGAITAFLCAKRPVEKWSTSHQDPEHLPSY